MIADFYPASEYDRLQEKATVEETRLKMVKRNFHRADTFSANMKRSDDARKAKRLGARIARFLGL